MNKNQSTFLFVFLALFLLLTAGCAKPAIEPQISQSTASDEGTIATITPENNIDQSNTSKTENEPFSSAQTEINITDGSGREVVLRNPAERIVSLAPSNTEILFSIGAGNQIVGRDSFSDYPEEASQIEDVGGGYGEFDLEKIVSLSPDLVLASSLNPSELVTKLEGLNINVFYLTNPNDLDGMYENLLIVAQLTGHVAETEILVEELQTRVDKVLTKIKNVEYKPLVFYEIDGTDPAAPWTSGKGTFVDTLLTLAGGRNLGSVMDSEWAQISIEEIITQDPDIILIGDAVWGGVTLESVQARSAWETLSAIKNNRTYEFDDNIVSRPGPRLVDGLEALARLLHPDLFQ